MAKREQEAAVIVKGGVDPSLLKAVQKAQGLIGSIVKADLIASAVKTAGAAVGSFVSDSVKSYTGFEQSLATAGAIAGAQGADFDKLKQAAIAAGKSTQFTAAESADALGYMALAGWNVNQSVSALEPVLKMAQATGAGLAATSDAVTDSMTAMGVGVQDLDHYLDVIIQTNNRANTTAADLMEAFKLAGAGAKAARLSVEDTSTALGVLANVGVKGSEAGRGLYAILNRMTGNEKVVKIYKEIGVNIFDAAGRVRDFKTILQETGDALGKMTDEKRAATVSELAGVEHGSKFLALIEAQQKGADGAASSWENLRGELSKADGALQTMNARVTATISGAMARFSSAVDGARLALIDKFAPQIAAALDWLASVAIPKVEAVASVAGGVIADICGLVAAIDFSAVGSALQAVEPYVGYLAIAVGTLTAALAAYNAEAILSAINARKDAAAQLFGAAAKAAHTAATAALAAVTGFLTSPITLVIVAIGALVAACYWLYKNWDMVKEKAAEVWASVAGAFSGMYNAAAATITDLCKWCASAWETIKAGAVAMGDAIKSALTNAFSSLADVLKAPINAVIGLINSAIEKINGLGFTVPKGVPGLGGMSFAPNLSAIPMLASGGIATGPTLSMIGEGAEPEAVLPLSKLGALLGSGGPVPAGAGAGGGVTFAPVININGAADEGTVSRAMGSAFEEFKRMMAQYERERIRRAF